MADIGWHPDLRDRSVTVERVEAVAFTPMAPRLRNELITRAYGDLAHAMAKVMGTENATWSVLGLWASNTIGDYLELPVPILGRVITRPFADGNRDVFADVGRAQACFLTTVGRAHVEQGDMERAWRECRKGLRRELIEPPGRNRGDAPRFWDTITDEPREGKPNQRALVFGFRAYFDALLTTDADEKARLVLLGNILLALHEQRHLSMPISLGFRSWLRTILRPGWPLETQRQWMNRPPSEKQLDRENRWVGFATRHFVGVQLSDETIKVSKPVPKGERPVDFTPTGVVLDRDERPRAPDMTSDQMLDHFFNTLGIDGEPVGCWNSLHDRMSYISALFVEHQRSDRWWNADGTVVRPEPSKSFDRKLSKQIERMAHEGTTTVGSGPCPLSDEYLDSLRAEPSVPHLPAEHQSFDRLHGGAGKSVMLEAIFSDIEARLDAISGDDGLWSPAVVHDAHELFGDWEVLVMMALLFRSLPDAYAAAKGVKVIGTVSSLATDPFRRSGETAHFIRDLLAAGPGWNDGVIDRDGEVFRSIAGLRGLHSIMASRLVDDGWDSETYGVPLNEEDVLGTALSFAVPFFEMTEDMGVTMTPKVRDSYVSFWLGVGYLLGAPLRAVTVETDNGKRRALTYDEARSVALAIRRRHHLRSLDGVRLTEALLEGVADGFPRRISWLAAGWMKALGNPAVNDLLLVGGGRGRRRSQVLSWSLQQGLRWRLTRGMTRGVLQYVGRIWLQPFFDAGTSRPFRQPRKSSRQAHALGALNYDCWPAGCSTTSVPAPSESDDVPRKRKRRSRGRRQPDRQPGPRPGSDRTRSRRARRRRRRADR